MNAGRPVTSETVPWPIAFGELGETIRAGAKMSMAPTLKPLNSRLL